MPLNALCNGSPLPFHNDSQAKTFHIFFECRERPNVMSAAELATVIVCASSLTAIALAPLFHRGMLVQARLSRQFSQIRRHRSRHHSHLRSDRLRGGLYQHAVYKRHPHLELEVYAHLTLADVQHQRKSLDQARLVALECQRYLH